MLGKSLTPALENDTPVRDAAIFGYHGSRMNVTDGQYTYFRENVHENRGPLYSYTMMTNAMRGFTKQEQLGKATLAERFSFTENIPPLKIPVAPEADKRKDDPGHLLFDVVADPKQQTPLSELT